MKFELPNHTIEFEEKNHQNNHFELAGMGVELSFRISFVSRKIERLNFQPSQSGKTLQHINQNRKNRK
jgi:hypothetical protein